MLNSQTFEPDPDSRPSGLRYRLAFLTSHVFNPFLICVGLIILFSARSSASFSEAVKWSLISAGIGLLPVFLVIIYLLRHGKVGDFFIAAREERHKIYIIGCLSAAAGSVVLALLDAPSTLVAGFATGTTTAIVFAIINLWWKISLHTAIVAASATILVFLYGWTASWTLITVPLTAWSRIELDCHSFKQTVGGAVLAAALVMILFPRLAAL
jgi:membrane-associated phospholipid phosphatase